MKLCNQITSPVNKRDTGIWTPHLLTVNLYGCTDRQRVGTICWVPRGHRVECGVCVCCWHTQMFSMSWACCVHHTSMT